AVFARIGLTIRDGYWAAVLAAPHGVLPVALRRAGELVSDELPGLVSADADRRPGLVERSDDLVGGVARVRDDGVADLLAAEPMAEHAADVAPDVGAVRRVVPRALHRAVQLDAGDALA